MADYKNNSSSSGVATALFPKGRLKIFLGACPGVGKTFAMLQAAAERREEGIDVVIGFIETHQRKETELQLANLEILPRKTITYRGKTFNELDLEGILKRSPQLVLIDECAHSNFTGSRHPKRYNDIEEILNYGIDVYTTLNIQHIDSLKDDLAQMMHVKIRETIPDSFLESADEIQLIDLPPDDLLKRLEEGKVYVPDMAKAAMEHFFNKSNLLTLRELALKHAITVADDNMSNYNREHGVKGAWPASDNVMVCVGTDPSGPYLIRSASRIAERLQAKWVAVTVEVPSDEKLPLVLQEQRIQSLRLAETLGAEVLSLEGVNIAETLVDYALTHNVTDLIIGQGTEKTLVSKIPFFGAKTVAEQILSYRPALTLRVFPIVIEKHPLVLMDQQKSFWQHFHPYLYSLLIILAAMVIGHFTAKYFFISDVFPFFMISIIFVSIQYGFLPPLWATIITSFIYYDYSTAPQSHLEIFNLKCFSFVLSLSLVSIITSFITLRAKKRMSISRGRLFLIRYLSQFLKVLLSCQTKDQMMSHLCSNLHTLFKVSIIGFWEFNHDFTPIVEYEKFDALDLSEVGIDALAISWSLAHKTRSGRSTETFSDAHYLYMPIKIGNNSLGVIGLWPLKGSLKMEDLQMAQILIDQSALAIDRLNEKQNLTET